MSAIPKNFIPIALIIIIALILINIGLTIYNRSVMIATNQLKEQTEEVKQRLMNIFERDLGGIDKGLRGYMLTENKQLLDPYTHGGRWIPVDFRKLDSLFKIQKQDTILQHFNRIRIGVEQYLKIAEEMKGLAEAGKNEEFLKILNEDHGYHLYRLFEPFMLKTISYEDQLVKQALSSYRAAQDRNVVFQIALALLSFPTIILVILRLNKWERDVTHEIEERKKTEQELTSKNVQLAKTNRELDRFVYSASHDMRAPLKSLLGLILLAERENRDANTTMYLSKMKTRIGVMEEFICEVTDYSRNVRTQVIKAPHNLLALVHEVVDYLAQSHGNPSSIIVQIDPSLIVNTDKKRLKIALNNLVANAQKFKKPNIPDPFIHITASQSKGEVIIEVADNGVGIEPQHHHRLFDMFYRASEYAEGSGLGLYIAKETLDNLGGKISVKSEYGVGSTFTITIPI